MLNWKTLQLYRILSSNTISLNHKNSENSGRKHSLHVTRKKEVRPTTLGPGKQHQSVTHYNHTGEPRRSWPRSLGTGSQGRQRRPRRQEGQDLVTLGHSRFRAQWLTASGGLAVNHCTEAASWEERTSRGPSVMVWSWGKKSMLDLQVWESRNQQCWHHSHPCRRIMQWLRAQPLGLINLQSGETVEKEPRWQPRGGA